MLLSLRRAAALRVLPISPLRRQSTLPLLSVPTLASATIEPLSKSQLKTLVLSQYRQGKFSNLLRDVVSSPAVLLTACHNLTAHKNAAQPYSPSPLDPNWVAHNFFSLEEMAAQLAGNRFDIESCCVALPSSGRRGPRPFQ